MSGNPLGRKTPIPSHYTPEILHPISRSSGRETIEGAPQHWLGFDRWRCYEFSYLRDDGKPTTGVLSFSIPASSISVVESKSLKLYLAGLNNHRFSSQEEAVTRVKNDLQKLLENSLDNFTARVDTPDTFTSCAFEWGECIDESEFSDSPRNLERMVIPGKSHEQRLHSHLLRTLCPITSQPDWATLWIDFKGPLIDQSVFLKYLVSMRNHQGYHETCCEEIFVTFMRYVKPDYLAVGCFFTRRGGIDISPFRWSNKYPGAKVLESGVPKVPRQ